MPTPKLTEFLLTASKRSLQDFMVARLNHVNMLTKQLRCIEEQIIEERADAQLAGMLIEDERLGGIRNPLQEVLDFAGGGSVESAPKFSAVKRRDRDAAAD